MMDKSGERLREARIKAGFKSSRSAALKNGWNPSTYASHENGQTPVPKDAAADYARQFKVRAGWILTGEGDPKGKGDHKQPHRTVPVHGYVGAGTAIHPFDDHSPIDEIELPVDGDDLNCVIVRGLSMYPRYFDGEKLFYSTERRSPSRLINEECVVHLTNGQMLIKIIRRGSRKTLFNLESWNAPLMEDQAIDWASPVLWRCR